MKGHWRRSWKIIFASFPFCPSFTFQSGLFFPFTHLLSSKSRWHWVTIQRLLWPANRRKRIPHHNICWLTCLAYTLAQGQGLATLLYLFFRDLGRIIYFYKKFPTNPLNILSSRSMGSHQSFSMPSVHIEQDLVFLYLTRWKWPPESQSRPFCQHDSSCRILLSLTKCMRNGWMNFSAAETFQYCTSFLSFWKPLEGQKSRGEDFYKRTFNHGERYERIRLKPLVESDFKHTFPAFPYRSCSRFSFLRQCCCPQVS